MGIFISSMEKQTNPKLSVVIASDNASYTIKDCLYALTGQSKNEEVEIIVVDCSTDDTNRIIKTMFPDVYLICFPERTSLPMLLGVGIAHSNGDIIAITDANCVADPNWISEILKAHETPYPIIGGAVEIGKVESIAGWAAYFCDYGQFMRPLNEGAVNELPGNNISLKRWALKKGQEFVQNGFWKTYWCQKLQEEGFQLVSMPSIVVYYNKSFRLRHFLARRFHHGRCFAGMRIAKASISARIYYIAGSPALPFLFLGRTVRAIVSKKRYLKEVVLSLPVSIMAIVSWSFGEFWGYLTGPGNSCDRIYIH